jgi:hypothetical protein
MNHTGEWRYSSTHSLTLALDGGEWSASHTSRFTCRERAPGSHWIGGWVGPRAVLEAVVKRKIPSSHWESNPRTPIVQPIAQRYTDLAIMALLLEKLCCLVGQEIPCLLLNPQIHYCVNISLPLDLILSLMNPVHALT